MTARFRFPGHGHYDIDLLIQPIRALWDVQVNYIGQLSRRCASNEDEELRGSYLWSFNDKESRLIGHRSVSKAATIFMEDSENPGMDQTRLSLASIRERLEGKLF